MTILHIPQKIANQVFELIPQPVDVVFTVKVAETLPPELIEQLDKLGVHYLTTVE